jgi:hypothetical protein
MTRRLSHIAAIICWVTICISCSAPARLYRAGDKNEIESGILDADTYHSLRQLLAARTGSALKDTLIIKYNFNNEVCWRSMDQRDDSSNQRYITWNNQRVQMAMAARPNISVFTFREPGNNTNKVVKWNHAIIIDSSKQLLNLVFKKRTVCGSSLIVVPDRRFNLRRSDSHFQALDQTSEKIEEQIIK